MKSNDKAKALGLPTEKLSDEFKQGKVKLSNAMAAYNGYSKGLTVEWMSSVAGVSKSTIYRQIKRYREYLSDCHEKLTALKK